MGKVLAGRGGGRGGRVVSGRGDNKGGRAVVERGGVFGRLGRRGGGGEDSAGPPQQGGKPREHMASPEEMTYDAASPKQRKEILGNKILPLIKILEPEMATNIMNYLLPMINTDLDNLVRKPSELVKKVCDLINKSQDGTYHLPAGGGGGRGAEGPHGHVDEGGDGFCV